MQDHLRCIAFVGQAIKIYWVKNEIVKRLQIVSLHDG